MIWALSLLLLLVGGGQAVPINGSQVAEVNSSRYALQETVEGLQNSIQFLYSKLKVVESQLNNGETRRNLCMKWCVGVGGGGGNWRRDLKAVIMSNSVTLKTVHFAEEVLVIQTTSQLNSVMILVLLYPSCRSLQLLPLELPRCPEQRLQCVRFVPHPA